MRIIAHLDMDAFFASIEERDNPRFKGMPLVVGADPKGGAGRGVVSTANYKAREYGIRSALPISTAWRFSEAARRAGKPGVIFLSVDMKKYGEVSDCVMAIARKYAKSVEEASVDEAYLDISSAGSYEKARSLCILIKKEIKKNEQLTASVGIGPNKLIAKIASDMQKPDGLTVVREEDAEKFLEPLSIRTIPGIGPKTEKTLNDRGIKTIFDLKQIPREKLAELFGKWGFELYEKARGRSDAPLVESWEAKSIGEQETFETDSFDPGFLTSRLEALAQAVFDRFAQSGFANFKTLTVTVRFADFTTKNRSHTFNVPVNDVKEMGFAALTLFMPFLDKRENPGRKAIRLLGVRIEKMSKQARIKKDKNLL